MIGQECIVSNAERMSLVLDNLQDWQTVSKAQAG